MNGWRDIDHTRRTFGFGLWRTGAEISLGKRLYRIRWSHR